MVIIEIFMNFYLKKCMDWNSQLAYVNWYKRKRWRQCFILRIWQLCGSCTVMDAISLVAHRILNAKWYFIMLYWYF